MKVKGGNMIKIKNKSRLSYRAIGTVIDKYRSEEGFTMYEGMKENIFFEYKGRHYKLDVKTFEQAREAGINIVE